MTTQPLWIDLARIVLQIGGAVLVAWLAVRWALTRYETEKTWERRLGAYADLISALGEMRRVVGRWADEIEGMKDYREECQSSLSDRYQLANRRFEETVAVAKLILAPETFQIQAS